MRYSHKLQYFKETTIHRLFLNLTWQFDCNSFIGSLISTFKPELCQVRKGPSKTQMHLQKVKATTLRDMVTPSWLFMAQMWIFLGQSQDWGLCIWARQSPEGHSSTYQAHCDDNRGAHVYSFQTAVALPPRTQAPSMFMLLPLSHNLFFNFMNFLEESACSISHAQLLPPGFFPWIQPTYSLSEDEGHSKDTAFSHRPMLLPSSF